MDNAEFVTKNADEKIDEIISRVTKNLQDGESLTPIVYLFDVNSKLTVIEITDKLLLKKDRTPVVTQLIKETISELKNIDKVLFLREGYYHKDHPNKNSMNLDEDFNKRNSNEALIVTVEDQYNFNLRVYDMINIFDNGDKFSVISSKPIEELDFCKIDPECNIKTNYINLVS